MSGYILDSKTVLWGTPRWMFKTLNDEFHFNLDAAANSDNHKCDLYFTEEQDGLKQSWSGHRVYCNPPYGRHVGDWLKKAYEERNNCGVIVVLVPAKTDTLWFHNYVLNKAEIRFIEGRLNFNDSVGTAPFPSMLVIYRNDSEKDTTISGVKKGDYTLKISTRHKCKHCGAVYKIDKPIDSVIYGAFEANGYCDVECPKCGWIMRLQTKESKDTDDGE